MAVGPEELCAVRGDGAERCLARDSFTRKSTIIRSALRCRRVGILWVTLAGDADFEGKEFIKRVDLSIYSQFQCEMDKVEALTGQSLPYTTGLPAFSI
jgi:hypothetical protein